MKRLSDISTIKEILSKHGFTFSKALGQNFLVNPSVCPRMAEYAGAGAGVGVIEIGPGIGVLTNELCQLADKVVAVELDKRLLPVLDETLAEYDNVKIVNADVLELDLNQLIEEEFAGLEVVVCANLPYYITSPVIMKLLEEQLPVKAITVMVQKEAAQRICAKVGVRMCGAVDSAVIRLNVREKPPVDADKEKFFAVVKASFGQRRKVIANSLSAGLGLGKEKVLAILEKAGVPQNARAEALRLDDFAAIANAWEEMA